MGEEDFGAQGQRYLIEGLGARSSRIRIELKVCLCPLFCLNMHKAV